MTTSIIIRKDSRSLLVKRASNRLKATTLSALLSLGLCSLAWADPTVSDDAFVSTVTPARNFGRSPVLSVTNTDTAYLQFQLVSGLPAGITGADLSKATLKLFVTNVFAPGTLSLHQSPSPWNEASINEANAPLPGPQVGNVPITGSDRRRWIVVDVTSLVKDWLDDPSVPNSLVLVATGGLKAVFDSKENIRTGHEPVIEVNVNGAGSSGATGAVGATGPAGVPGLVGPPGATGPVGAPGAIGATGTIGPTGSTGATGLTFQGPWNNVTTYAETDTVSFAGSSYISLQGSNLNQQPDTSPAFWSLLAQAGATGATGATGSAGTAGATGATGLAGTAGPTGATGAAGSAGATGAAGPVGATGPAGPQGLQGIQGLTGLTGATGAAGALGATGATGTTGATGATGPTGAVTAATVFAANNSIAIPVDFYAHPSGAGTNVLATIFNSQIVMPRSCTFDSLHVVIRSTNTTPPTNGADRAFTYTLNVNGTDNTNLTCTSTSVLNTNVSCSDTSGTVAVSAGDLVTIHVTAAGAAPTPAGRIISSLRCQ
jgi:hypothetical protein